MASGTILSPCRLQILRGNSSLLLTDLKFRFEIGSDSFMILQSSESCSSDSFVAYELTHLNCTYLASESIPSDAVFSWRNNETVTASAHPDRNIEPENVADEITTLRMCCSMVDIPLLASCQLKVFVTSGTPEINSITQHLTKFIDGVKKTKPFPSQIQPQTVCESTESYTESINASSDDLDQLERLIGSSKSTINLPKDERRHKLNHYRPSPIKKQVDLAKAAELEEFLVDNRKKNSAFWDHVNKKGGVSDVSKTIPEAESNPATGWTSFAVSHGSQLTQASAPPTTNVPVLRPRDTRGYSRSPSRFYDRSYHFSSQVWSRNRGRGGNRFRALASLIPSTNKGYKVERDEDEEEDK